MTSIAALARIIGSPFRELRGDGDNRGRDRCAELLMAVVRIA
jgi:hypothetical protein